MPFRELGLSPEVLRAITDSGYETPTPIQERAIPSILLGRDILGAAQTGTGKTASFTLPMIDILATGRVRARMPRSLILEPTRELAAQVAENFDAYGKYSKLTKALLVGGVSFSDQDQKVDRGVDVLIATPGRLLDHVERGKLMLSGVSMLVIDEADRMLDMGFIPDVERIVGLTPRKRQTLMFSATLLPEIRRFADAFLSDPKEISVDPPASTVELVTQGLVVVHPDDKQEALRHLLRQRGIKSALIFCNRKRNVDILASSLRKHGFEASGLHGDMNQAVRTRDARPLPGRRHRPAGRQRRRRARPRHRSAAQCRQLRRAAACRGLHPPHRPHRSRRNGGGGLHPGGAGGCALCRGDRQADGMRHSPARDRWRRAGRA